MSDYSNMSDEELDNIISGNYPAASAAQSSVPNSSTPITNPAGVAGLVRESNAANPPEPYTGPKVRSAAEIQPSALERGASAAIGALGEPFIRAKEKFELMFPGDSPEAQKATIERIGKDRAKRADWMRYLEDTTAGNVGGFVGKAAPMAIAGPEAGAQAGLAGVLGFLGGGSEKPTGIGQEMAQSGVQGATDAAVTGALTKGLQLGSKAISGLRGKFTPEGQQAIALNASANRLGVPSPTIGQLDPNSPKVFQANPLLVNRQAQALERSMAGVQEAPAVAGGIEQQIVPGARFQQGLKQAVDVRKQQANAMYSAVDDYAKANNLAPIKPSYSVNVLSDINKKLTANGKEPTGNNLAFNLLDNYDPEAFSWLKRAGSPAAAKNAGMSMTDYHASRVATGRALNALDRVPPANRTADQIQAQKLLVDLKNALDNDVGRWAKSNADNEGAMDLYNRAKDFYAKTAGPAVGNPLAKKVASTTRGFESPERMYSAITNPQNRSLVDRLRPTSTQETLDMINTLQGLPGMKEALTKGTVPQEASSGGLGALIASGLNHPASAAMRIIPGLTGGLREASRLQPVKNAYFGASAPGYITGPMSQYLAANPEERARRLLGYKSK